MADNLQTKTEKLLKYANEKFGTNESNLRNIIDNAKLGEDLTEPLNEQATLLNSLETEINGLGGKGAIIRTAELANIDITLAKDGTTIQSKNTGAGGKVDFNVSEVGTYTISTSTWNKEVEVKELNTIVKAYAGDLVNYTIEQIHEACQGAYASLMWKPKDVWTYPTDESIYSGKKIMITSIRQVDDKEQIRWCLADKLSTTYVINPRVGVLNSKTSTSWTEAFSNLGGMKYSAMEQRFKVQGEEVYSQAQGLLPEDYSGTLTTGVKLSELYYTDQNEVLCKLYKYYDDTDSFEETTELVYTYNSFSYSCPFIKGYFKSVGTIDEQTFNSGYYYVYDSAKFVYTRATSYTSGTTYYGLYETLQEDGVFIPQAIRQYLVKEERKAQSGRLGNLSSFRDYANLLAMEEITGIYYGLLLPTGINVSNINNTNGEGEKEEGFDFSTQLIGSQYWTRSSTRSYANYWNYISNTGSTAYTSPINSYGVRPCFTTN